MVLGGDLSTQGLQLRLVIHLLFKTSEIMLMYPSRQNCIFLLVSLVECLSLHHGMLNICTWTQYYKVNKPVAHRFHVYLDKYLKGNFRQLKLWTDNTGPLHFQTFWHSCRWAHQLPAGLARSPVTLPPDPSKKNPVGPKEVARLLWWLYPEADRRSAAVAPLHSL